MRSILCEIIKKEQMLPDLFSFWLNAPDLAAQAKSGQFVHIRCGEERLLRRPISICEVGGDGVRIVAAVVGAGTKFLAEREVGDRLDVLGPLGKGFDTRPREGAALIIGGGIGVFPLLELAKQLQKPEVILGFRTKELVVMQEEFRQVCSELHIATDDGSMGHKGYAVEVAKEIIGQKKVGSIYACGPMGMLRAVKQLALDNDIFCQISLEERMGCGVGACMTCVCKHSSGVYVPVCKAGPVFNAQEADI